MNFHPMVGFRSSLFEPVANQSYPGLDFTIGKVADSFDFERTLTRRFPVFFS
jgi:hypothetical protein